MRLEPGALRHPSMGYLGRILARTIPMFSCDIGYSRSPAASMDVIASLLSGWNSIRMIRPRRSL